MHKFLDASKTFEGKLQRQSVAGNGKPSGFWLLGFLEWSPSRRRQMLVKTRNKFVTTNRRNCLSHRSARVHPGDTPGLSSGFHQYSRTETKEDSAYFPINFSSRGSSSARKHYVTHVVVRKMRKNFPVGTKNNVAGKEKLFHNPRSRSQTVDLDQSSNFRLLNTTPSASIPFDYSRGSLSPREMSCNKIYLLTHSHK